MSHVEDAPSPPEISEGIPTEVPPEESRVETFAPPPQPFPGIRWSFALVVMVFLLQLVFGLAAGVLSGFIAPEIAVHPLTLGLLNLASFAAVIALALQWPSAPARVRLALRSFPLWWLIPVGVGMVGLQIVLSDLVNFLLYVVPPPDELPLPADLFFGDEDSLWAAAVTLVLIAPVTEELLFRGVLMHGLLGRHRPWVAIVVPAGLFGLLHILPWQIVPTMLIGLVLGWIRLRGGSVFLCIWAHIVNNAMALFGVMLPFDIPGYTAEPLEGQIFQPFWFTAAGAGVAIVAFAWLARSETGHDYWKKDEG